MQVVYMVSYQNGTYDQPSILDIYGHPESAIIAAMRLIHGDLWRCGENQIEFKKNILMQEKNIVINKNGTNVPFDKNGIDVYIEIMEVK